MASNSLIARTPNFDPDKIVYSLLDLSREKKLGDGNVSVKSFVMDATGLDPSERVSLTKELFNSFTSWNRAVYLMNSKTKDDERFGTAFHIGHRLMLTNAHVLSENYKNLTRCDGFKLKGSKRSRTFSCHAVHHCDVNLDVCLIEMKDVESTSALKLRVLKTYSEEFLENGLFAVIGNTFGQGPKFSQGRSMKVNGSSLYTNTPLNIGNSGSPLINEAGEAIGIVHRMRPETDTNWDLAISSTASSVVRVMREALRNKPEILERFNQAVLE